MSTSNSTPFRVFFRPGPSYKAKDITSTNHSTTKSSPPQPTQYYSTNYLHEIDRETILLAKSDEIKQLYNMVTGSTNGEIRILRTSRTTIYKELRYIQPKRRKILRKTP